MSSEVASLREEFAKLLAEVKQLRAEAAAGGGQSGEWGKQWTARGHPDVRAFPDHPGVNPAQMRMDLKEMETMLLDHADRLSAVEQANQAQAQRRPSPKLQADTGSGSQ